MLTTLYLCVYRFDCTRHALVFVVFLRRMRFLLAFKKNCYYTLYPQWTVQDLCIIGPQAPAPDRLMEIHFFISRADLWTEARVARERRFDIFALDVFFFFLTAIIDLSACCTRAAKEAPANHTCSLRESCSRQRRRRRYESCPGVKRAYSTRGSGEQPRPADDGRV